MTDSLLTNLGAMIHELRTSAGMTQRQLAAMLDTSQGRIPLIEKGRSDLKISTLERIADAFDSYVEVSFVPYSDALDTAIDELVQEGLINIVTPNQE